MAGRTGRLTTQAGVQRVSPGGAALAVWVRLLVRYM